MESELAGAPPAVVVESSVTTTRVAVCAATLHRPKGLAALLDSLRRLEIPAGVVLAVVIVDNHAEGSAEPVVDEARRTWPKNVELRYAIQPRPGIAPARNLAVALAPDADWIAFVDDDETVHPDWLSQLLNVATDTGADVVTGTVLPIFEVQPPSWVLSGGFFERRRFPTGTRIPFARTSNALVAARLLQNPAGPFNEGMGRNGGEDTHFFQQVRIKGGRIVWADEAVVVETVPDTRVSTRWLIQREYRRGNTLSLCLRDLEDSPARRVKRCAASGYHALVGAGIILSSLVRGRVALVRGLQQVAFAAGLLVGLTGHVYEEYTTVHGS
jgi:succinoglycan biosynthesis protein ExoM